MNTTFCITGARVIDPEGSFEADVIIDGQHIDAVLPRPHTTELPQSRVDADGLWLLPGGIDAHTHFGMPLGDGIHSRGWRDSSTAALMGGTTTVIDFANPAPGQSLCDAVDQWRRAAAADCLCDYGLHVTIADPRAERLAEIPGLIANGLTSFKAFLAYKGRLMLTAAQLYRLMSAVHEAGGHLWLHAEDGEMNDRVTAELLRDGRNEAKHHPLAHPAESEITAIRTAISLAGETGCPLTVVHLSTAEGLRLIHGARRDGLAINAEVCIQHLFRDESWYARDLDDVLTAVLSPPLRQAGDGRHLREHLNDETIVQVSTDHCEFPLELKRVAAERGFPGIPNGGSGVGERLIVMFTSAVQTGLITPERWVDLCCSGPARNCGLWRRKGRVQAGLDADLVLFDPLAEAVHLPFNAENSLWRGDTWQGQVVNVWRRGEQVLIKGAISQYCNQGAFIPRSKPWESDH